MALSERAITVKIAGGIETKIDRKTVPSLKLLTLENGVFTHGLSISKRNGYADVPLAVDGATSPIAGAKRSAKRDNELLAFTKNRCYSKQSIADQWTDAGAAFSVVGTDRPGPRTGTHQTMPDHATASGVTAYAWEDSRGGVWWTSVDSSTGRVCRAPEQLDSGGTQPRCVVSGDVIHVYWANVSLRSIRCIVCNPATPSAAVTVLLLIDDLHATNTCYDAEATTYAGSPSIITWIEFGTTNFKIAFVHPSGQIGSPIMGLPTAYREVASAVGAVAVSSWRSGACARVSVTAGTTLGVQVFYYQFVTAAGVTSFSQMSAAIVNAAPTSTRITSVMLDTTDATTGEQPVWVAFENASATPSKRYVITGAANTTAAAQTLRSVALVSRAWEYSGDAFVVTAHDTTYFNVYLTARLSDLFVVGRHLAGSAAGTPTRTHVSSAPVVASVARVCVPMKERVQSTANDKFTETGLHLLEMNFDSKDSHGTAQLGRGLYMAGACPLHYDGKAWTEQGFHVGPEAISAVTAGGGSLTPAVTYNYKCWYEWTDGQGEVHRGPESVGLVVAMGASTQVTLTVPTLRVTGKTNVRICVGRSLANDSTKYYRVSSSDPNTSGAVNGYIANDKTIDSIAFIDRMDDATVSVQEPMYTNGGILSNDPSGLGSVIAVGKSRLFFTDPSNPNVVRYSQEFVEGFGAACPPENFLPCDPAGGAIRGLAVQDDKVIVFKERVPFWFAGEGPDADGSVVSRGFSAPQMIQGDAGCSDPNSIAVTPAGTIFKSAKGIYLVDRGMSVSYVGAPVEGFNAQDVRRATLMDDRTQVVFLTSSGKTLLYDYLFGQWSTYTNHEGYDACVVGGQFYYLRTDGRVFRETPGVYSDAGRAIVMRIETAWLKMLDWLQGFQQFWHLHVIGERKSAHQLKLQVRTDYASDWSDPAVFDATAALTQTGWLTGPSVGFNNGSDDSVYGTKYDDGNYGAGNYGGSAQGAYQWRFHLGIEGQAIQLRFEDYESAGSYGASYELSELLITGGVMANAPRPFSNARSL